MNTPISVNIDKNAAYTLGDVVILKHQAVGVGGKLMTYCSSCGTPFKTIFRRMKPGQAEVRNIPRCKACRHDPYRKKANPADPNQRVLKGLDLCMAQTMETCRAHPLCTGCPGFSE